MAKVNNYPVRDSELSDITFDSFDEMSSDEEYSDEAQGGNSNCLIYSIIGGVVAILAVVCCWYFFCRDSDDVPAQPEEKPAFVDVCETALKTCGYEKWVTVTKGASPPAAETDYGRMGNLECTEAEKAAKVQLDSTDEIKKNVTEFETKAKAAYETAQKNATADKPAKKWAHHETLQKCKYLVSSGVVARESAELLSTDEMAELIRNGKIILPDV